MLFFSLCKKHRHTHARARNAALATFGPTPLNSAHPDRSGGGCFRRRSPRARAPWTVGARHFVNTPEKDHVRPVQDQLLFVLLSFPCPRFASPSIQARARVRLRAFKIPPDTKSDSRALSVVCVCVCVCVGVHSVRVGAVSDGVGAIAQQCGP